MTENPPLNEQEIFCLKKILEDQKDKLVHRTKQFNELKLNEEDRSDDVDHANADYTNAQMLRFRNRDNFYEKKIDQALLRIKMREYGLCKECDAQVNFSRLKARPTAELCIKCKEESEREESASYFGRKSKSIGRRLSLANQ